MAAGRLMGAQLGRIAGVAALGCSILAFVLVMTNIILGVPPQADEDASAHIWQLLIGSQLPLMLLFILASDWRARPTQFLMAVQLLALAAACLPVFLAGY